MKKSKKILIIVIILLVVLAILGGVLAFLALKTDAFKSPKELFGKYISQEIDNVKNITSSQIKEMYKDAKKENMYESKTNIGIEYSEGGEVSNPINELKIKAVTQKDQDYLYKTAQLQYQNQEYLQIETIKDGNIYGVRFTDALRQFLSVEYDENTIQNIKNWGLDAEVVKACISFMNSTESVTEQIIPEEDQKLLIEKYSSIITEAINNATFSKQSSALITLNSETVKTNAYQVSLTSDQVENMLNKILTTIKDDEVIIDLLDKYNIETELFTKTMDNIINNLGIDTEIPGIKITVYEQNGITVRTVLEIDTEKIIIESSSIEGNRKITIERKVVGEDSQEEQKIKITKTNTNSEENYDIKIDISNDEDSNSYDINLNTQKQNGIITTEMKINTKKGITNTGLKLENEIDTNQIGTKVILDNTNNVIMNNISEEYRNRIFKIVEEGLPNRINTRIQQLSTQLNINGDIFNKILELFSNEEPNITPSGQDPTPPEEEMSQIEINRFNAKFEFYTGQSVSADNVKALLEIVKSNLKSVDSAEVEGQENVKPENIKHKFKLTIEKDVENEGFVNDILKEISDKNKYNVEIEYNSKQLIESINIIPIIK